jgi:hypothetical protein
LVTCLERALAEVWLRPQLGEISCLSTDPAAGRRTARRDQQACHDR